MKARVVNCAVLGIFVVLLAAPASAQTTDTSEFVNRDQEVSVAYGRMIFNRRTAASTISLTVANISGEVLPNPIIIALKQISPATLTFTPASITGFDQDGDPVILVNTAPPFGPNTFFTINLTFNGAGRARASWATHVYAGVPDEPEDPPDDPGPTPETGGEVKPPVLLGHDTRVADTTVQITGQADANINVEITGPGIDPAILLPTDPNTGSFTADVPLRKNAANRISFVAIDLQQNRSAATQTVVTSDLQAPKTFIDFPKSGDLITGAVTDVTGRVGDLLSGYDGMVVTVNGVTANVNTGIGTNGTFFAKAVPLNDAGQDTVIQATATDILGNEVTVEITVQQQLIEPGDPQIVVLAGGSQEGQVNETLENPIVIQVTQDGNPVVGKVVTFSVERSDGGFGGNETATPEQVFQTVTDEDGEAIACWTLGSDAGEGNNLASVSTAGAVNTVGFCASAAAGDAAQLNVGEGNSQQGETGTAISFSTYVNDGCNGIAGVDITFSVTNGDGVFLVPGSTASNQITVESAATGHAEVSFVLGEGQNTINANFEGNPTTGVTFTQTGLTAVPNQPTTYSGIVSDNAGCPIGGAACTLEIADQSFETTSNLQGQFQLNDITSSGFGHLHVSGVNATHVNGVPIEPGQFPTLNFEVTVVEGAANDLGMPVLLPPLNPGNESLYSTTNETILTCAGIDGLKMTIAPGSMTLADGTDAPAGTVVSVNQVHHDDVPMPMPDGANPPFAWTVQPGGATFDPPVKIQYPNMSGLAPGSVAFFLTFDHSTEKFEIVGTGTVTDDGSCVISDPGSGLTLAGWGCNCPPYSVAGDCEGCSVTVSGPSGACTDALACFSASGDPGGGTYSWSTGGGAIEGSSTGSSIKVKWSTEGSKTVKVTYTCPDTADGPGGSDSDSKTINVGADGAVTGEVSFSLSESFTVFENLAKNLMKPFKTLLDISFTLKSSIAFKATGKLACCPDGKSGEELEGSLTGAIELGVGVAIPLAGKVQDTPIGKVGAGVSLTIDGAIKLSASGSAKTSACDPAGWKEGSGKITLEGTIAGGLKAEVAFFIVSASATAAFETGVEGTVGITISSPPPKMVLNGEWNHKGLVLKLTGGSEFIISGAFDGADSTLSASAGVAAGIVLIAPGAKHPLFNIEVGGSGPAGGTSGGGCG